MTRLVEIDSNTQIPFPYIANRSRVVPGTNAQVNPQMLAYIVQDQFVIEPIMQSVVVYQASSQEVQLVVDTNLLTAATVQKLSGIPEVERIFQKIDDSRVYFYVFTDNKVYDFELMKRLIQIEIDMSHTFPNIGQTYRYTASVLVEDARYITGCDASLLYTR